MDDLVDFGFSLEDLNVWTTNGDSNTSTGMPLSLDSTGSNVKTHTSNNDDVTQVTNFSLDVKDESTTNAKSVESLNERGGSHMDLFKLKEKELRIMKERLRIKDEALQLELELTRTKKRMVEQETGVSVSDYTNESSRSTTVCSGSKQAELSNFSHSIKLPSPAQPSRPEVKDWENVMKVFAEGVKEAPLPPRDVRKFAGDPLDYHRFVAEFDDNIVNRVKDPMTKLTYLISHCVGQAYDAIQSTIIIRPPEKAFDTATKILCEQFGQEYKVVAAHMKLLKEEPRIKEGDADSVYKLATQMRNCSITLTEWGYCSNLNNHDTIDKIFLRLPHAMQREFQKRSDSMCTMGKEADFGMQMEFIQHQARLCNTRFGQMLNSRKFGATSGIKERPTHSMQVSYEAQQCFLCGNHHPLWKCSKFIEMEVERRKEVVLKNRLCFNCLSGQHVARKCMSKSRCKQDDCGKPHHTLLHDTSFKARCKFEPAAPSATEGTTSVSYLTAMNPAKVWLKVVPVEVWSTDRSRSVKTHAFLDNGSTSTLCTQELMRRIDAQGEEQMVSISTVNGEQRKKVSQVNLFTRGIHEDKCLSLSGVLAVRSLPQLTKDIPGCHEVAGLAYLSDVKFPQLETKQVDLLIGADNLDAHEVDDERKGKSSQPTAVHTALGWALIGKDDGLPVSHSAYFTHVGKHFLRKDLKDLFSCELCDAEVREEFGPSLEDRKAVQVMENHSRTDDGKYMINLPWKHDNVVLPDNRQVAKKRLDYLKRRFLKDDEYFSRYKEKMNEYLANNYARIVPHHYSLFTLQTSTRLVSSAPFNRQ